MKKFKVLKPKAGSDLAYSKSDEELVEADRVAIIDGAVTFWRRNPMSPLNDSLVKAYAINGWREVEEIQ